MKEDTMEGLLEYLAGTNRSNEIQRTAYLRVAQRIDQFLKKRDPSTLWKDGFWAILKSPHSSIEVQEWAARKLHSFGWFQGDEGKDNLVRLLSLHRGTLERIPGFDQTISDWLVNKELQLYIGMPVDTVRTRKVLIAALFAKSVSIPTKVRCLKQIRGFSDLESKKYLLEMFNAVPQPILVALSDLGQVIEDFEEDVKRAERGVEREEIEEEDVLNCH